MIRASYACIAARGSTSMRIDRVGIIGSGLMGSGIAQVAACSGCEVTLVDVDQGRVDAGISGIRKRLEREAERGRITANDCADASARLFGVADMETMGSLTKVDAVIEAVVEDIH